MIPTESAAILLDFYKAREYNGDISQRHVERSVSPRESPSQPHSHAAILLEKVKVMAGKTGQAATRAVESAGKMAGDMAQTTKIHLQIFDLNTECEVLYKEIGKLVYEIHLDAEVAPDAMDGYLEQLDELREKIEALRAQLTDIKAAVTCPACGRLCSREDTFCAGCGAALKPQEEPDTPAEPTVLHLLDE